MLKHKSNKDPISSTTAGYLNSEARLNILQKKEDVFQAAVLFRDGDLHKQHCVPRSKGRISRRARGSVEYLLTKHV